MVTFWHSNGSFRDEADFPQVAFWHPDRNTAREEATRVLIELREERGDERDWTAAGHPDPFEVDAGRHTGGQWILRYSDLSEGENRAQLRTKSAKQRKSAAGAWKGIVDGEKLKQTIYEARRGGPKAGST
jgi:hypothetical protein